MEVEVDRAVGVRECSAWWRKPSLAARRDVCLTTGGATMRGTVDGAGDGAAAREGSTIGSKGFVAVGPPGGSGGNTAWRTLSQRRREGDGGTDASPPPGWDMAAAAPLNGPPVNIGGRFNRKRDVLCGSSCPLSVRTADLGRKSNSDVALLTGGDEASRPNPSPPLSTPSANGSISAAVDEDGST
jgi:hypothetical protein